MSTLTERESLQKIAESVDSLDSVCSSDIEGISDAIDRAAATAGAMPARISRTARAIFVSSFPSTLLRRLGKPTEAGHDEACAVVAEVARGAIRAAMVFEECEMDAIDNEAYDEINFTKAARGSK